MPANSLRTEHVIKRVMLSQFLFMAGNSLTVGGIFNYFVSQFSPSGLMLAALLITPETSQSLSVLGRSVAIRYRNRKRNWIIFLILGRLAGMLLPFTGALLFVTESTMDPLLVILVLTALWYLLQGIAYVNYISWLSDLVPETNWGKLFSRRQLAGLFVSLGMPLAMLQMRQKLLNGLPPEAEQWSYCALFLMGGVLTLTSILPLLCFEDVAGQQPTLPKRVSLLSSLRGNPSFRYLLASRWWLAFFQGLTQAAFFKFAREALQLSLITYMCLTSLMIFLQMPMAIWGGQISDRFDEKRGLFWSMVIVSCAMPFWISTSASDWYLIVFAYVLWGGFGMLNVCGQNLCLKLAPPTDNSGHFALYDQISGLIAGIAGLIGGFALDSLIKQGLASGSASIAPYLILFTISWAGRITAPLWLLPIRQPTSRVVISP